MAPRFRSIHDQPEPQQPPPQPHARRAPPGPRAPTQGQQGGGHRLGPNALLRKHQFRLQPLPTWIYLTVAPLIVLSLLASIRAWVVIVTAYTGQGIPDGNGEGMMMRPVVVPITTTITTTTTPTSDTDLLIPARDGAACSALQPAASPLAPREPPDDPVLSQHIKKGCQLHRRVGEMLKIPWATLDLGEINHGYAYGQQQQEQQHEHSSRNVPSLVDGQSSWGSVQTCANCLAWEKLESLQAEAQAQAQAGGGPSPPWDAQQQAQAQLEQMGDGMLLPQSLSESLVSYMEDRQAWEVYTQYFGRLFKHVPGVGGRFENGMKDDRRDKINALCDSFW